jgi:hypothetical protein
MKKPFVLSHNAATGYADSVTPFVKNQNMDFTGQLNCGARALDLRLGYQTSEQQDKRDLKFHHTKYMEDQTVANDIGKDVKAWAKRNPDELVILILSHCKVGGITAKDGDCDEPFFEPFRTLGIHVVEKAEELKIMTVKKAEELAQIKDGGKILAIYAKEDNVQSNWDENIVYGGTRGICFFSCKDKAWDRLWAYCNVKLDAAHDMMWQLQAIWQSGIHPEEETKATEINKAVAERILGDKGKEEQDKWNKLNFLLLNVVECHAPQIAEYFGAKSKDQCPNNCYA